MEQTDIKPDEESLRVQLSELNNRSRWYSAQSWHIPFAYFGILLITASQIHDKAPCLLPFFLIFMGIFGILVLWHMCGIINGAERAVKNLKNTEKLLNLPETAQLRRGYVIPLFIALIIGVDFQIILT